MDEAHASSARSRRRGARSQRAAAAAARRHASGGSTPAAAAAAARPSGRAPTSKGTVKIGVELPLSGGEMANGGADSTASSWP